MCSDHNAPGALEMKVWIRPNGLVGGKPPVRVRPIVLMENGHGG
jgi:hypothetical protein